MSQYASTPALMRTLGRFKKSDTQLAARFEAGQGTRPATKAFERQQAINAAVQVLKKAARSRLPPEERRKEIGRRRKWAGGGNMPADVRACYSEAERAALSVIVEQCKRKGFCDLCIDEIASIAGVKRTSVQNAVRKARSKEHAHISVRERRPQKGAMSLTNIIKIIGKTWLNWIERALGLKRAGGFKRLNTSETAVKNSLSESVERPRWAFEREGADRPNGQSHRLFLGFSPGLASSWIGR